MLMAGTIDVMFDPRSNRAKNYLLISWEEQNDNEQQAANKRKIRNRRRLI
jgi:hypothetical protein